VVVGWEVVVNYRASGFWIQVYQFGALIYFQQMTPFGNEGTFSYPRINTFKKKHGNVIDAVGLLFLFRSIRI
jgi:hypothetical protein